MKQVDNQLMEYIIKENLSPQLFKGSFGLEKENLRVDRQGKLALTPHPKEFGDKLYNPYIKTDFSESQIEVVTPVCGSIKEVYCFLENLQDIVSLNIGEEYLWPQSNPPILPEEDEDIPIAVYESEGIEEREYREKLAKKYGRNKQLISGIHYNFSFDEDFLKLLYREFEGEGTFRNFKDAVYLKVAKNFLRYRWLLIYLTGSSPAFHKTFEEKFAAIGEPLGDSLYLNNSSSLRSSKYGYKNEEDFIVSYDSLEGYTSDVQSLIDDGKIASFSEFYNPVRLRVKGKKGALEQLKNEGIKYLELRIFDLNPFNKNGISIEDVYLIHLFMVYMLVQKDIPFNGKQQEIANRNHDLVAVVGRQADASIYNESGQLVILKDVAIDILTDMEETIRALNVKVDYFTTLIQVAKEKVNDPAKTYANGIIEEVRKKSYVGFHLEKAKEYLEESSKKVNLSGFEDLELSTQILIRDAITRGITFDILDREENFIKLKLGDNEILTRCQESSSKNL